jgi:hypothetical protein
LTRRLESHLVWPVGAAQAEAGSKVVDQVGLLLDVGEKGLVDGLLVLNTVLGGLLLLSRMLVRSTRGAVGYAYLRLLALLEERVLAGLVGGLVLGEVAVLASLLQDLLVNALDVHGGRGSNDEAGVYSSQRNAVDFERTGDEENTLGQVLEEHDTLAAETTGEEDDDGTGLKGGTGLRGANSLTDLGSSQRRVLGNAPSIARPAQSAQSRHAVAALYVCLQRPMPISLRLRPCRRMYQRTFLRTATSVAG